MVIDHPLLARLMTLSQGIVLRSVKMMKRYPRDTLLKRMMKERKMI